MAKNTLITTHESSMVIQNNHQFQHTGGKTMKKQLHIQVNGFDIYLGISKNAAYEEKALLKAYENDHLKKEIEVDALKAEYELQRLTA